jgi:TBC1 domain family member 2
MDAVPDDTMSIVEADSFWCMSKLLDSIQENYTFAQPGIQKMIFKLQELVVRIDGMLCAVPTVVFVCACAYTELVC